jgi:hypothetical protein
MIRARFCSRKATFYIAFAFLGISQFGIQQGLGGQFLGEILSHNSFSAFFDHFSVAISVGSFDRIFVGFWVVIWQALVMVVWYSVWYAVLG